MSSEEDFETAKKGDFVPDKPLNQGSIVSRRFVILMLRNGRFAA